MLTLGIKVRWSVEWQPMMFRSFWLLKFSLGIYRGLRKKQTLYSKNINIFVTNEKEQNLLFGPELEYSQYILE